MAHADLEVVMARPVQTGRAQQRTIRVDTFDGATTIEFSTRGARTAFRRLVRHGGVPADLLQIAATDGAPAAAEWRAAQRRLEMRARSRSSSVTAAPSSCAPCRCAPRITTRGSPSCRADD